jgi:hypothetical protein
LLEHYTNRRVTPLNDTNFLCIALPCFTLPFTSATGEIEMCESRVRLSHKNASMFTPSIIYLSLRLFYMNTENPALRFL